MGRVLESETLPCCSGCVLDILEDWIMTYQEKREIDKAFRAKDQSHLWPISGGFNATERALDRVRRANQYLDVSATEYRAQLEAEISAIVNEAV